MLNLLLYHIELIYYKYYLSSLLLMNMKSDLRWLSNKNRLLEHELSKIFHLTLKQTLGFLSFRLMNPSL